jgi:hypothetical protein
MCYGRDVSHDENEKVQCNSKSNYFLSNFLLKYLINMTRDQFAI